MKKLLFLLSAACAVVMAGAVEIDGIAARVGTDSILRSDVIDEMQRQHMDPSQYKAALEKMIERKLIIKAAGESKMTMQEWVIESRIREIIERGFDGDRNKLMETLSQQKVSYPEWRARMKDDMIIQAMQWQIIDKNIIASPAQMKKEWAEHPERYLKDAKVTVEVILLRPEDVSKRDEITEGLKTKPFGLLAKTYSAGVRASEGGLWKDVKPADVFNPTVCAEIAKLKVGETSPWVTADNWSFLIRKDAETLGSKMTYEEAYDQIAQNIREDEAKVAYDAWIQRLKDETFIQVY